MTWRLRLGAALLAGLLGCSGGSDGPLSSGAPGHRGPIRPLGGSDALGADLAGPAGPEAGPALLPEVGPSLPEPGRDAGSAEIPSAPDGGDRPDVVPAAEAAPEVPAAAPDLRPLGPDATFAAPDLRPGPDVLTSVPDVLTSGPDLGKRDVQPLGPGAVCGEASECKSGICSKVTGRCCQTTCPNNGCNFGCDTSGMCSACATCTCDATTGLCHC